MISIEIRKLIVADVKDGISVEDISRVLRVGESTIRKLVRQERETGSVEPRYKGRQPKIRPDEYEAMLKLAEKQPDVTLEEIRERLNLPIKKSQISNLLRKAGYRLKKDDLCPGARTGGCCGETAAVGRSTDEFRCITARIFGRKWY